MKLVSAAFPGHQHVSGSGKSITARILWHKSLILIIVFTILAGLFIMRSDLDKIQQANRRSMALVETQRLHLDDNSKVEQNEAQLVLSKSKQHEQPNSNKTPASDVSLLKLPSTPYKHTLKVPFYVYEGVSGLDWLAAKLVYNDTNKKDKPLASSPRSWKYKHDDDYWFHYHALKHPMRTHDPSKAQLFFVPVYLNAFARSAREKWKEHSFCLQQNHTLICNWELFWHASDALKSSPWFQRHSGRDHIIVNSHFNSNGLLSRKPNASFYQCNTQAFEKRRPNVERVHIPSMYIGSPCKWRGDKSFDFTMVAHFHPERTSFQTRRDICDWINDSRNFSVSICGKGEQCPALAKSRYGFHARGDTYGSNRLMDTLLSGTIPLFTEEEQYDILPDFVPWKKLSYFVNVSSPEAFHGSLAHVLAQRDDYKSKTQLIVDNLHLLDHTRGGQFDAYMAKFADLLGIA